MNYLVDTNALSELAKPQPAGEVMAWFVKNEPHLYVSSISLGEIRKGLELRLPANGNQASKRGSKPFASAWTAGFQASTPAPPMFGSSSSQASKRTNGIFNQCPLQVSA
jgi:hypothetical protein